MLIVVVVVEQESLRLGVLRNWFFVRFFVCFGFRVFLGFCGWVPEALCNPAQMRTQDGPAFRGSRPEILHKCGRRTVLHLGAPLLGTSRVWACCTCFTMLAHSFPYTARVGVCRTHVAISILVCHLRKRKVSLPGVYQELWTRITRETS